MLHCWHVSYSAGQECVEERKKCILSESLAENFADRSQVWQTCVWVKISFALQGNLSWHNIEWSFFHSGRIWVVSLAKYYPVFLFTHCTAWSSWQNIIDWSCLQSLGECPAVRNARLMSHFLSTILTQRLWCEHLNTHPHTHAILSNNYHITYILPARVSMPDCLIFIVFTSFHN